jgi:hypothetical protein
MPSRISIAASDGGDVPLVCALMCSERTDKTLLIMSGDGFGADLGETGDISGRQKVIENRIWCDRTYVLYIAHFNTSFPPSSSSSRRRTEIPSAIGSRSISFVVLI